MSTAMRALEQAADGAFDVVDGADAVVDDKHLSVATEFEIDGFGEDLIIRVAPHQIGWRLGRVFE
ncbi:hypothetical protein MASR1M31_09880 [Porphyromonadaceae bacterium]